MRVSGDTISFELSADLDPSVNIWEAERKTDLLEREFGFAVREWLHAAEEAKPEAQPAEEARGAS